ncbi:MAG: LacI family DNA-binding transcriptional regulator [Planctomycetota bacterium]
MARTSPSVSILEVARHADVSAGTVSRVFNRHPSVGSELRRRVLQSSRQLGFAPKIAHRSVGVVTGRHSPSFPMGYVGIMTSLVSRMLSDKRHLVELIDIESLDLIHETHLDGVIGIVFDERLADLTAVPSLPIVSINHPMSELGISSVYGDHYQQGVLATRHLIEQGHRQIGFLAIEEDEWGSQQRLLAYKDTLAEHGIVPDPEFIQYTTLHPAYDTLARWKHRGVTAILNFSEDACMEVLHILTNVLGLAIGKDISTISLEDLPIGQYLSPPQTVIRQPLEQLARLAVDHMIQACESPKPVAPLERCLPTELIVRDSVARISDSA